MVKLEYIPTNLKRYTFENKKFKQWVESNCGRRVLNLFAGITHLNVPEETRNDVDPSMPAEYHMDALDFATFAYMSGAEFDTIVLDPPYAYRKAMEMYNGNYCSRFKLLADAVPDILSSEGNVISFGYHSTFLGKRRGFILDKMCIFGHGGAQHCTIGIIERRKL